MRALAKRLIKEVYFIDIRSIPDAHFFDQINSPTGSVTRCISHAVSDHVYFSNSVPTMTPQDLAKVQEILCAGRYTVR